MPKLQISTGYPMYSFFKTISGLIYEGVPQKLVSFLSFGLTTLNPKSIILTSFLSSNKRFSNFMSRCTTFLKCKYFIPSTTYLKIFRASSSGSFLPVFDFKYWYKDKFDLYSIIRLSWKLVFEIYRWCGVNYVI